MENKLIQNIMKNTTIIKSAILSVMLVIVFNCTFAGSQVTKKEYSKEAAISKIKEIKKNTDSHSEPNSQLLKMAEKAKANFGQLVYITEVSNKVGYHTKLYLALADIASKSDKNNDFLYDIADIIGMNNSANDKLIDLARRTEEAKTDAEKAKIKAEIEAIKSKCHFKTIDEAIESSEEARKKRIKN